ncbi:uncharacterized protein LOC121054137 [Oryza brachyantha]|uniref:uncharacterized protein LOC121054137 n=1 Tax=Oryza brachyantha TaxID=4533 RepID=UPI001ADBDB4B|nr:uncharacterized protein LOC121054137 [Oryza brachyantha]
MEERFLAEPLRATTVTCIPRLRGGGGGARRPRRAAAPASSAGAAPVSVLDRVRDVVLRLAMLSAATTKGALPQQQTAATVKTSPGRSAARRAAAVRMSPSSAYTDSYRSEAVDECIEFLKRSAAGVGVGGAHPVAATVGVVINSPSPLHASASCAM